MRAEPGVVVIAGRCAVRAGLVLLGAVPVYLYLERPWRALVAHAAAGLVLGTGLLEVRRALAVRLAGHGASALDAARRRVVAAPEVPPRLLSLMASVRAARRSRRHFEDILWPQLSALARRPLVRPPGRRGRGPGLAALRLVVATLEDQR
jgi:hypothetical protein